MAIPVVFTLVPFLTKVKIMFFQLLQEPAKQLRQPAHLIQRCRYNHLHYQQRPHRGYRPPVYEAGFQVAA
jgi:hypothetical protein